MKIVFNSTTNMSDQTVTDNVLKEGENVMFISYLILIHWYNTNESFTAVEVGDGCERNH